NSVCPKVMLYIAWKAELVLPQLLFDAIQGVLKPFYHNERLPIDNMPKPYSSFHWSSVEDFY
ncbi:MAG: hypothetical protein KAR85_02755, partial [Methanosarcinales archaeon]|nr:hypothetical protein [Methanosarcinales archaeon]